MLCGLDKSSPYVLCFELSLMLFVNHTPQFAIYVLLFTVCNVFYIIYADVFFH